MIHNLMEDRVVESQVSKKRETWGTRLGASDRAITRFLLISIQDAMSTRPPI